MRIKFNSTIFHRIVVNSSGKIIYHLCAKPQERIAREIFNDNFSGKKNRLFSIQGNVDAAHLDN